MENLQAQQILGADNLLTTQWIYQALDQVTNKLILLIQKRSVLKWKVTKIAIMVDTSPGSKE